MAIFNKKTEKEQAKPEKGAGLVAANSTEAKGKQENKSKENTGDAFRILIRPVISEKSYILAPKGQFIFRVSKKANKISVKRAVEKVYDVHVTRVNIINIQGKARTFGRISGRTSDWKKAIVTLKKGESIGEAQI